MNILHILSANIFDILTVSWEYFYRVWDIVEYSKCESVTITQFQICQSTSQVPFLFSVVVGPQFLRTSCELQDLTKFLSACTFMYLQDKVPWVVATGLGSLEFQDLDRHGGPDNVEYLEKFTYLLLSFSKFPAFSCRGFLFFRQRVL